MLLGAIYLGFRATRLAATECGPGLGSEDCFLEETMALELSRLLFFSALGLVLVAAGILIAFRRKKEPV